MKVTVGTLNPVKLAAVRAVLPEAEVIGYNASPGLDGHWRSVPGQPIGQVQTLQGATNRLLACPDSDVVIGIEDGLVPASELGLPATGQWYNQTVVVYGREYTNVQWGTPIPCEFVVAEDATAEEFTTAMQHYQEIIQPRLQAGQDLYQHWTAQWPGGPYTRGYFISKALRRTVRAEELRIQALRIVHTCAANGMSASAGPRYRGMLWTRDLAYMAPIYLQLGYEAQVKKAWRFLGDQASRGKVPIVVLDPDHEHEWVHSRVSDWRQRLVAAGHQPPLAVEDVKKDYWELCNWCRDEMPPPSFALRHFMAGTLGELTPGTQDSELQLWRTALHCHWDPSDHFTLTRMLVWQYQHVIDPEDGLPRGADTRDIFAEPLYHAKLLSNAVHWYSVLDRLAVRAMDFVYNSEHELPVALRPLLEGMSVDEWARSERDRLAITIQTKFFDVSPPRDFLPVQNTNMKEPLPAFVQRLLDQDLIFATGTRPDPQGLAYAVLSGLLVDDKVVDWWRLSDSPMGVTVFVPISAREGQEQELLTAAKGFCLWPHINWAIIRACRKLATPKALTFAREQEAKLLDHTGCAEWYVWDSEKQKAIAGGDNGQGWSASQFLETVYPPAQVIS